MKKSLLLALLYNRQALPGYSNFHITDKIMRLFFTTKLTNEGTGLGLSLTYDMVVKGHGGTIQIDSKEDEYTLFTIQLPLS